ncbi:MAG: UvrD-helicase domain-containing protein, partial [Nocardioidaceae bacterium]
AGSGKTESLVGRVAQLVLHDHVPMRNIAAVTFTEKAGAELRDRLRVRFEHHLRSRSAQEHGRAAEALADLDTAAIGTLHSFAQLILTTYPIEAGLPPLIDVLDEVASSVAFDERWSVMQRALLDSEELSGHLLLAMTAGLRLDQVRSLARAFGSDWDLIDDHVGQPVLHQVTLPDLSWFTAEAARLAAVADSCRKSDDNFLPKLHALGRWGERLAAAAGDEQLLAVLLEASALRFGLGKGANWADLTSLRADCYELQAQAKRQADEIAEATLRPLADWVALQVRESARERALKGRLEFHDLLVLARELLRRDRDVRAALQQQFQRLLLDELQDTDPIQIELAVRIAGGAEAEAPDWRDVAIPAGSVFAVGDPKQSIYRFRRASIRTYLEAQQHVGETVRLTTNFRTVGPALDWVNAVFGTLIQPAKSAQPRYEPLETHRTEGGVGPAVVVLGRTAHDDQPNAAVVREREAADVAAVIHQAVEEEWTVTDSNGWRPVELGDIAILLPARTSLDLLEEALTTAGIAYRTESSSLVYQAREVRDLMAAARTLADPTDLLSCVSALRSALFGCGDDDLWTWKVSHGSFN